MYMNVRYKCTKINRVIGGFSYRTPIRERFDIRLFICRLFSDFSFLSETLPGGSSVFARKVLAVEHDVSHVHIVKKPRYPRTPVRSQYRPAHVHIHAHVRF